MAITGKAAYTFRYRPPVSVPIAEIVMCCGKPEIALTKKWMDFFQNYDPFENLIPGFELATETDLTEIEEDIETLQEEVAELQASQFWEDVGGGDIANTNLDAVGIVTALYVLTTVFKAELTIDDPEAPAAVYTLVADINGFVGYWPANPSVSSFWEYVDPEDETQGIINNNADGGHASIAGDLAVIGGAAVGGDLTVDEDLGVTGNTTGTGWIATGDWFYVPDTYGLISDTTFAGMWIDDGDVVFNSYEAGDPNVPYEMAAFTTPGTLATDILNLRLYVGTGGGPVYLYTYIFWTGTDFAIGVAAI